MSRDEIIYLVPYLASLLLSVGVFIYAWRHRRIMGGVAYAIFVGGQTLSIFGFILELISQDIHIKIFWDQAQWLTDAIVIAAFPIFAIQFTEYKLRNPRLATAIFFGIPIAFILLVITDGFHHLIYPDPHLQAEYPFTELEYSFTAPVYLYSIYIYVVTLAGIGLVISRVFRPQKLFRSQMITVAIGFLIPVVVSILALLNIHIAPQRDATPFTFAIGNLIVAWGLFRYHLFEVVPVARDTVVENMGDPVVVLDRNNQIIDLNPAAAKSLGLMLSQALGRPASEVFAEWKSLMGMFTGTLDLRTDVALQIDGRSRQYELHISPLRDRRARILGRVFVLSDVTERAELQAKLQSLNEELEQRVRERTEELRKSAESYRAVVENQTEFIVRWHPDGTRTFTNEAYRRYFGLTPEEAISDGFMPLVVEEDRRAVEEKLARLRSGSVSAETDIHRVIKPDGSIGWQEWTDQAVLNEQGQIIEFQSVGRDITERKQAEENLAEAYNITLQGWAKALELRDKETEGHSRRVTELTLKLARASGIAEEALDNIRRGAILHDIGKMSIPDEILRKPGPLTEEERQIVQKHPLVAYELLSPIRYLQYALEIPYCHHEKWDGSGYPRGLKGEEIPLSARIFAVADVWDAVQSDRPYNKGWPREKATDYLKEQSGHHFDPVIVNTFIELVEQGKI